MKPKSPLSVGYFGDGPWAHDALRRLIGDKQLDVVFVSPRFQSPDPILTSIARGSGIPILCEERVNAAASLDKIRSFGPDLLVSMSYDQIIREPLLKIPPHGFINCHAGKLPSYRGRNILNWALINGEKEFGITVHHIDQGIDTGPIILQKSVPIRPDDDYSTVLLKAQAECGGVLHAAIDLIRRGRAKPRIQNKIHPVGFYCGRRRAGDEFVDWGWDSRRIHDFVRGVCPPAPGARTNLGGRELVVLKTALVPKAPRYIGRVGEVVGRDPLSVSVKTGDSTLRILLIGDVDPTGKVGEARVPELRIGDRLGTDLRAELLRLTSKVAELESRLAAREEK